MTSHRPFVFAVALAAIAALTPPVSAQVCTGSAVGWSPTGQNTTNGRNCVGIYACYSPQLEPVTYVTVGGCDPTTGACSVRAQVRATFRGNRLNQTASIPYPGSPIWLTWTDSGGVVGNCGQGGTSIWNDIGDAWIQAGNFSCADPNAMTGGGDYSLRVRVCQGATGCNQSDVTVSVPLEPDDVAAALCPAPPPPPRPWSCGEGDRCQSACMGPGGSGSSSGGGASSAAGGGPGLGPIESGPGAMLRYQAGGTGHSDHPKPADWTTTLGRYWSHDYAERIVVDPDPGHVWLLTRWGTFREFTDAGLDGTYETAVPSDEYRQLTYDAVDGWTLTGLDGMVHRWDIAGRWIRTEDRHGNAKVTTYDVSNRLERVDFPDGRREDFGYDVGGRLETITEVGIDGSTSRTWTYTWSGDDLERIDRPDGTAWRFEYTDPMHPGFMTAMIRVGTDGTTERIEGAWAYDAEGNVTETWRGAATFADPAAVDTWSFSFDDPSLPAVTTVTDPLGNVSTYTLGRDPASTKPRIEQIDGDCPTCGLGPNSQLTYGEASNPLRATQEIDGRGITTLRTYTAFGQLATLTEALGETEERTTTWTYDPTFPALVDRIERPSTSGNPLDLRVTDYLRSAQGEPLQQTIEGIEDGAAFSYTTVRTFTAEGQVDTIDPPGDGMADVTSFTYDPLRGDLLPDTRTDPLIGVTTYGYDPFNRRTSVTDPNGVAVETEYDALDRVTFVREKGATTPEDLVTEYRYTVLGDLFQVVMPEGNVIEYSYDAAGRLEIVERKPDDLPASHGERIVYGYDAFGHRTSEVRERWDGGAWVVDAESSWTYSTRCHLDVAVQGAGGTQSVTEYAYDCNGNLDQVWDANHPSLGQTEPPTTEYVYDNLDRLVTVRQPFGGAAGGNVETSYRYDVQDHLTRVTDGEGTVTAYVYSDRDLMTSETSEVSGTSTYGYDEGGDLTSSTDARGVTVIRMFDELDRVTSVDYPDDALDINYTYDAPGVPFSLGRLTQIARGGSVVDYRYDRFGRVTQDGALTFTLDENGNRTQIIYPGGLVATHGYDYADRPSTVSVTPSGVSAQAIVASSQYRAGGMPRQVVLGNGLTETRAYDDRDHPTSIVVGGLLDWTYTTDGVGNPTSILDNLNAANHRTYGYQEVQYFLEQGDGPWGQLGWTYDKLGNRLTETRDGATADVYAYLPNVAGGNSPILDQISLGAGGTVTFGYDSAGNQTTVDTAGDIVTRTYDDASRLSSLSRPSATATSGFRYDGRSYLDLAEGRSPDTSPSAIFCDGFESGTTAAWVGAGGGCFAQPVTVPTYSSEGLLHSLHKDGNERRHVVYFGDRPVAITTESGGTSSVLWLSVDHLGTPVLATDVAGTEVWSGGFEPFGADYAGAQVAGLFLRFAGQWEDSSWNTSDPDGGSLFNVSRWYSPTVGRYSRTDPLGRNGDPHPYLYVSSRPLLWVDPLGEKSRVCCTPITEGTGVLARFNHCFIQTQNNDTGVTETYGLHRVRGKGCTYKDDSFDMGGVRDTRTECGPWSTDCGTDPCVAQEFSSYPSPSDYQLIRGPNSNSFASTVASACAIPPPSIAGTRRTPGWGKQGRPAKDQDFKCPEVR